MACIAHIPLQGPPIAECQLLGTHKQPLTPTVPPNSNQHEVSV